MMAEAIRLGANRRGNQLSIFYVNQSIVARRKVSAMLRQRWVLSPSEESESCSAVNLNIMENPDGFPPAWFHASSGAARNSISHRIRM
jgi:hypothetical protein